MRTLISTLVFICVVIEASAFAKGLPPETKVVVGPSLIHVKKSKEQLDYKLWVFSVVYGPESSPKRRVLTCPYDEKLDEFPPGTDVCFERSLTSKVSATLAVADPSAPETDDEIRESGGMVCRYDSTNPMVIKVGASDTVCATPKKCKDDAGNDDLSHVSCPALPEKVKVEGKDGDFFVCPRLKGCESDSFTSKNVGKRTTVLATANQASPGSAQASTPPSSSPPLHNTVVATPPARPDGTPSGTAGSYSRGIKKK